MTPSEYIDKLRKLHRLDTDAAAARLLKVVPTSVRAYRTGRAQFGPETALRLADALHVNPAAIAADMMAARAKTSRAKHRWAYIATTAGMVAGTLLDPLYIMRNL